MVFVALHSLAEVHYRGKNPSGLLTKNPGPGDERKTIKQEEKTKPVKLTERKLHPVYDSLQWKELRYKTFQRFGFKCLACNSTNTELHIDHIKPISKYPELVFDENNLQVLCKDCNLSKSNKFEDDLRNKS